MNDEELRPQMFGITSPCIIKSMELAVAAKRLGIEVAPPKGDHQGNGCNRPTAGRGGGS
jgi:hypothetical protein